MSAIEDPLALLQYIQSLGLHVHLEPRPSRRGRAPGHRVVVDGTEGLDAEAFDELERRVRANARGLSEAVQRLAEGAEIIQVKPLPEPPRPTRAHHEPPSGPRREAERAARWARRWA